MRTDRAPVVRAGGRIVLGGAGVLCPSYRVTPFIAPTDSSVSDRATRGAMDAYLAERFPGRTRRLTTSGRSALGQALRALRLSPDDCVTILTTSGSHYVSGCVTREIADVCRWSREIERGTRAVLVIHEFGYPRSTMDDVRALGLPIVEDCCYAFASRDASGLVGHDADFVVLSFPKFFATPFGGALISRDARLPDAPLDAGLQASVCAGVDAQVASIDAIALRRQANWVLLRDGLAAHGCTPSFLGNPAHVPGVFLFDAPPGHDLQALKRALHCVGVECSVHYHRQAFFVPVHQNLGRIDLSYIQEAIVAGLSGLLVEIADA